MSTTSQANNPVLLFIFSGNKLLIHQNKTEASLPTKTAKLEQQLLFSQQHHIGTYKNQACYVISIPKNTPIPNGMQLISLRQFINYIDTELFMLAARAFQLLQWDKNHRYCGHCATPMYTDYQERVKRCPHCKLVNYPRISPAVIMRITDGDKILLSRSPHFAAGLYSVQAGFVEIGESLEQTVAREIKEETNLQVKNIRYFGSQPWPFPNSLMLAFTADYAGGELKINPQELEDAAWYTSDSLPKLPTQQSIARQMINDFINA